MVIIELHIPGYLLLERLVAATARKSFRQQQQKGLEKKKYATKVFHRDIEK